MKTTRNNLVCFAVSRSYFATGKINLERGIDTSIILRRSFPSPVFIPKASLCLHGRLKEEFQDLLKKIRVFSVNILLYTYHILMKHASSRAIVINLRAGSHINVIV